ncbi:hypothetical protein [Pseudomonas citronellolis]|uniref:RipA family octameric membrane protein n=1 Tax=Pseudomonas citronellolis TaxID=53408 RepID=UPI00106481FF|nr:hypothetical protein [Pseudomonas humi]
MSDDADKDGLVTRETSRKLSRLKETHAAEDAVSMAVNDLSAWKSIYRLCIELRDFEISQLVQRNNFFMIFQGVLFAGVCQSAGSIPVVSFLVCLAGVGTSLLQACMAAGAKYWQVHWEINTQRSEQAMIKVAQYHRILRGQLRKRKIDLDKDLASRIENRALLANLFVENSNGELIRESLKGSRPNAIFLNWFIMRRFSSSRIPIYTGLFLAVVWLMLLFSTMRFEGLEFSVPKWVVGFPDKPK